MEQKSRDELVQRIRGEEAELAPMPNDDGDKKMAKQNGTQQLETMLTRLQSTPPSGRMVIRISAEFEAMGRNSQRYRAAQWGHACNTEGA